MPSLFPGYEYDIFISYRQNDNRSRWVSDFVANLKEELAATLKDPLSIYFDENPFDGLLETDDVDKSLECKIKCIIFIPVLSQTYCDPKSFAWQHEFIAFRDRALKDGLGLDIWLSNGNVMGRILPVLIHDLDHDDKALFEKERQGALRAVNFIFKSPGVNRPLLPSDNRNENLTHTYYRDQINKVANAVKAVVFAIMHKDASQLEVFEAPATKRITKIKPWPIALAASVVLALVVYLFAMFNKDAEISDASSIRSLAVLPLENLTEDQNMNYFASGIQDGLIGELSSISALRVISRTSTLKYARTRDNMKNIATELGVDALIEGSIVRVGDSLRLNVQLIKPYPEEQHIWNAVFERDMKNILSLYGEIAKDIAAEVKVKLTPDEETKLATTSAVVPDAYDAYLRGQSYLERLTPQDLTTAEEYFNLALSIDPKNAAAYTGLAFVYGGRLQMGFIPYHEAAEKLRWFSLKAMELDSTKAEVHYILGVGNAWGYWSWEKAENEFRKAVTINPNFSIAHAYFSQVLFINGKPEEAMTHIQRALETDPLNQLVHSLYAMDLMYVGKYDELISIMRKNLERNPFDLLSLSTIRSAYHMKKMYPEAIQAWRDTFVARGDSLALETLNVGYQEGGYSIALQRVAEMMIKRSSEKFVTPWQIGTLYVRAGMLEEATEWIDKAYYAHDPNLPYIRVDPIFNEIKSLPEFQSIVKRMKFLE